MKHFYLIVNPKKSAAKKVAEQIAEYVSVKGGSCQWSQQVESKSAEHNFTDMSKIPKNTDCIITLGGDGTLIQASRDLVELQLPMIGVNLGHLGYMTQVQPGEDLFPMLDALLEGRYQIEKRMMISGAIVKADKTMKGIALNDIVLTRGGVMQTLKFKVSVNGILLNEYVADGMIISTPTGSTAYNLSAGGPIVTPNAELMILTPICSHALNSRSIVLSANDEISITVGRDDYRKQKVYFDGEHPVELGIKETLQVKKSSSYTKLIKLKDISFLDNVRYKMTRV